MDEKESVSTYAGRWVARVQGRIVAHGGTPRLARLAAQISRHKERPEISFIPPNPPLRFSAVIDQLRPILSDEDVYLAGGAVRDALLGQDSHDFDFSVRGNAIKLARQVAGALRADFYVLDESFGAARVIVTRQEAPRDILDFSTFRGPDVEADLAGRDFTINAIAYDPKNQTILDPLNGVTDLRAKVIRACSPSAFEDDPIRVLRAVRQAAALDFKIETRTREAMRKAAILLPNASLERQRDEVFRILDGPRPDTALKALDILGVFPFVLPELVAMKGVTQSPPHVYDVWEHTLSVVGHLERILAILGVATKEEPADEVFAGLLSLRLGRYRPQIKEHFRTSRNADRSVRGLLFMAALYHDVSKPATKFAGDDGRMRFFGHEIEAMAVAGERARRFNLSNDEAARLKLLIGNHMRFSSHVNRMQTEQRLPSRKAIYRFFRDAGEVGIDLVLLGLADCRGTYGHTLSQEAWSAAVDVARSLFENYWEKPQESVDPPRLVDGNDIMRELRLEPGPEVGKLLNAIREAQATGKVSGRTAALEFAHAWQANRKK